MGRRLCCSKLSVFLYHFRMLDFPFFECECDTIRKLKHHKIMFLSFLPLAYSTILLRRLRFSSSILFLFCRPVGFGVHRPHPPLARCMLLIFCRPLPASELQLQFQHLDRRFRWTLPFGAVLAAVLQLCDLLLPCALLQRCELLLELAARPPPSGLGVRRAFSQDQHSVLGIPRFPRRVGFAGNMRMAVHLVAHIPG